MTLPVRFVATTPTGAIGTKFLHAGRIIALSFLNVFTEQPVSKPFHDRPIFTAGAIDLLSDIESVFFSIALDAVALLHCCDPFILALS